MRQRQAELGRLAQEIALAGLLELKGKLADGSLTLTPRDAKALLDLGRELESAGRRGLARLRTEPESDGAKPPPKKPN